MIPYTAHHVTAEDEAAVLRVLRSDRLTQGPEVEAFEAELAAKCGAKYAVAVNSGTAALHLAYLACGMGPGYTAVVPALSFVATANAVLYCGGTTLFWDVNRETGMWDEPVPIKNLQVPVGIGGGHPCWASSDPAKMPTPGLVTVTVLDLCHGPVNFPPDPYLDAVCFSFHPAKHVAAGEGGAIVTNDLTVAYRCGYLRDHGRVPNHRPVTWGDLATGNPEQRSYLGMHQCYLGYNYRMDEMSAALARSQIARYDWSVERRRVIADDYDDAFFGKVRTVPHGADSARHLYQLLVENRDEKRQQLLKRGVGTQVHYSPIIPLQPYYRDRFGYREGMFPNAEWHAAHTLSIPMFPTLTEQEIEHVIASVLDVCG